MAKNILELTGVTKVYGRGTSQVTAVKDLDLAIPRGQMCAITGPSGSGKSTVMHLIAGLSSPSHGRIVLDGIDVTASSDDDITLMRRQRVAMIFQTFNLQAAWTAVENISFQLRLAGVPAADRNRRAEDALERLGLGHRKSHYPDQMSRGEQQRVAIARALSVEPRVLLADEPTGSLDSVASDDIVQTLQLLSHEDRVTTLLVTHDPAAAAVADREIRLRDGQLVADRTRNYDYGDLETEPDADTELVSEEDSPVDPKLLN